MNMMNVGMNDKLILTDCDGVLLDWEYRFNQFMDEKGYTLVDDYKSQYGVENRFIEVKDKVHARELVTVFNESAWIGWLPPLRDAIKYVRKLNEEHGYLLGVITSLSTNQYATTLRQENLVRVFGENAFDFIRCIETGADKDEELMMFQDTECWWIEDKVENAKCGLKFTLNPILIEHEHNKHYTVDPDPGVIIAKNWKDIYNIITGEQ